MRVPLLEAVEADEGEELPCPFRPFAPRYADGLQAELDVAARGAPGQQGVLLEDGAPVVAGPRHGHAVDQDAAGCGPGEPAEQVEQRGLAAAGGADEDRELAGRDVQVDAVEGGEGGGGGGASAFRTALRAGEGLADPLETYLRALRRLGHRPRLLG
ncbi:hypothetical protein GCM10009801_42630 [Streptomyces albiaxialis]|uniref:Uncharacterized protein n=1 Tax=Streptomyces albiaxialis TaxID=329523 RepID=A0ABP5HQV8_9ACTN